MGRNYVVNCCLPPKSQGLLPSAFAAVKNGLSGIGLGTGTGGLTVAGTGIGIPGSGVNNNFNAPCSQ